MLAHWAGEWPRSQQEYAANQLASGARSSAASRRTSGASVVATPMRTRSGDGGEGKVLGPLLTHVSYELVAAIFMKGV